MPSLFWFDPFLEAVGQKSKNSFVHFLGQMRTRKFASEIYWPLGEYLTDSIMYRCYIFYLAGNGTNVIYNHTFYNCTSPLDNINFRDAKIVGSLLPLGVVCLMVILGNIMVITAIRITKKLRGATNMFIGEKTMKPWIPVMRNSTIARFFV